MDIQMLSIRSALLKASRSFFYEAGFLEVDTPALSLELIPESSIEVFKTDYIIPYKEKVLPLFLLPSPEVYIKQIIAEHKRSFFQLSKCYRNVESLGRIHNMEFTMLEYYSIKKNYIDSIEITNKFLLYVAEKLKTFPYLSLESVEILKKGFLIKTVDELFQEYANFSIAKEHSKDRLIFHAKRLQPTLELDFNSMSISSLYDMIFVHSIEEKLPKDRLVLVTDYPYFSSCLAKEKEISKTWRVKERWELYASSLELCNCYTEERDEEKIKEYFSHETKLKTLNAKVKHKMMNNFPSICKNMPECSGVAMGFDRLLMFLTGRKDISSVIPFPLNTIAKTY